MVGAVLSVESRRLMGGHEKDNAGEQETERPGNLDGAILIAQPGNGIDWEEQQDACRKQPQIGGDDDWARHWDTKKKVAGEVSQSRQGFFRLYVPGLKRALLIREVHGRCAMSLNLWGPEEC